MMQAEALAVFDLGTKLFVVSVEVKKGIEIAVKRFLDALTDIAGTVAFPGPFGDCVLLLGILRTTNPPKQ